MGHRFLNHGAAHAAASASGVFVAALDEAAASLRGIDAALAETWRGVSAHTAHIDIADIVLQLNQSQADSSVAGRGIVRGEAQAREDEKAADRKAKAEEAARRAVAAAATPPAAPGM